MKLKFPVFHNYGEYSVNLKGLTLEQIVRLSALLEQMDITIYMQGKDF